MLKLDIRATWRMVTAMLTTTPTRLLTKLQVRWVLNHPHGHQRLAIHLPATLGEAVADAVVGGMGSWRFIIGQTCVVLLWITCNLLGWALRWDAYPFILLNLVFSTQAAYASPLILMAGNRSAKRDAARDDREAEEVEQLFLINQQQVTILEQQSEILDLLKAQAMKETQEAA